MQKKLFRFFGIFGLVLIIFGLVTNFLIARDDFYLIPIHFGLGCFLVLLFLLSGGLKSLGSKSLLKVSGYSVNLILYSTAFIGIVGFINYFVYKLEPIKYDSTEQKVFTLAPQSASILESLKGTLKIRAFYLGGIVDPGVEEVLKLFARQSDKVKYSAIDPEKEPGLVEKLGINQQGTVHLSYEMQDITPNTEPRDAKVVGEISEQDITNALKKLLRGEAKTVYYVVGHGEPDLKNPKAEGYLFFKQAVEGENLTVKELVLAGQPKIPTDASLIILAAPERELLDSERNTIKSYLESGGKAIFLADLKKSLDIQKLLEGTDIEVGSNIILEQEMHLFEGPSMGVQPVITKYDNLSPITKELKDKNTIFSTASSVRKKSLDPQASPEQPNNDQANKVTELAFTSDKSWAESNIDQVLSEDPKATFETTDIKGPVSIAASFEGVLNKSSQNQASTEKGSNTQITRIAVIGDSEFVNNLNLKQFYNRDFVLNIINWLLGDTDFINIRPKKMRSSLQTLSDDKFAKIFILTGVIFPEIILLCGLAVWNYRRTE